MAKYVVDGVKDLEVSDLLLVGESKFYLDTFKTEKVADKPKEVLSNKVELALTAYFRKSGKVAYGLGDISRAKDIVISFGGVEVPMRKSTALDSEATPVKNMSLCCSAEVGQNKYCKKCGKQVDEVGKMLVVSKDLNLPIAKDYLEQVRDLKKTRYLMGADDKGLFLSEVAYAERVRPHNVDTNGYVVSEAEIQMVEGAMSALGQPKKHTDESLAELKAFMANPQVIPVLEKKLEKSCDLADVFKVPVVAC